MLSQTLALILIAGSVIAGPQPRPASATPTALEGRPAAAAPAGALTPVDLQQAYNLPSDRLGGGQTVAVVAPYDNPKAEADLNVYREAAGTQVCGQVFPCLKKINQRGGETPPPASPDWASNTALALDMVSAACPNCTILLVEADDATQQNLGVAVDQAVAHRADIVLTTYLYLEYTRPDGDEAHYSHPGVPIIAAGGNNGFPSQTGMQMLPAAYPSVIAVGGTTLYRDNNRRGWAETAYARSGSGCSAYIARPAWQRKRSCGSKRAVADVAAVADPATPVAYYNSYGGDGWAESGGTGVGAALIAGVYALAGNGADINPGRHLYLNARRLFDITTGSTGSCGDSEMCTARRGYDGPTGLGTPNGIGAF